MGKIEKKITIKFMNMAQKPLRELKRINKTSKLKCNHTFIPTPSLHPTLYLIMLHVKYFITFYWEKKKSVFESFTGGSAVFPVCLFFVTKVYQIRWLHVSRIQRAPSVSFSMKQYTCNDMSTIGKCNVYKAYIERLFKNILWLDLMMVRQLLNWQLLPLNCTYTVHLIQWE